MKIFTNLAELYSYFSPSEVYSNFIKYKENFISSDITDENVLLCYKYTFFYLYTKSKVKYKTFCSGIIKEKIFKACLSEVKSNLKKFVPLTKTASKKEHVPVCNLYSVYKYS
ncbi:hypothetical protein NCER_101098 [Vairimorpha ceranae BRL01]|uniref:Uncharacterized protein n=2 Tax=Vairimorpha ceranae TaxID=40302 RepID=C4V982_VAIC1|nr:hypothetical protein AAJ76_580009854 [Vairimorpha ceranae]EEQ82224.1 hypothetical protein NCER_101098 [Vairimorpha ceranae BRL01]KAF5141083.1 hypothetical protein G9O61_00g007740 [Vairimorpha ceranae]KKO74587.1 hypothetical protein AAJ76_580009854 [Vairimorpha ceranae]